VRAQSSAAWRERARAPKRTSWRWRTAACSASIAAAGDSVVEPRRLGGILDLSDRSVDSSARGTVERRTRAEACRRVARAVAERGRKRHRVARHRESLEVRSQRRFHKNQEQPPPSRTLSPKEEFADLASLGVVEQQANPD
jgi:hypothetical protein